MTKEGKPKLVQKCTLPLTGAGVVSRIYSDYAVLDITDDGFKIIQLNKDIPKNIRFSAVVIAVAHDEFRNQENYNWKNMVEKEGIIFDLKGILKKSENIIRP